MPLFECLCSVLVFSPGPQAMNRCFASHLFLRCRHYELMNCHLRFCEEQSCCCIRYFEGTKFLSVLVLHNAHNISIVTPQPKSLCSIPCKNSDIAAFCTPMAPDFFQFQCYIALHPIFVTKWPHMNFTVNYRKSSNKPPSHCPTSGPWFTRLAKQQEGLIGVFTVCM